MMLQNYITLKEFCDLTKISPSTAYRMLRNGTLPAVKLAGTRNWKVPSQFVPDYDSKRMQILSNF